jgi:hypothetical protein
MKAFYIDDIITEYKPLDFEGQGDFIIITEQEYQDALTNTEQMVNIDGKIEPYSKLLEYYKNYKRGEIEANLYQANLRPAIHSANLIVNNVITEEIVDFSFKVMETGLSVINPCIILLTTIILEDNQYKTNYYYSTKKVVDNVITKEDIIVRLNKNLALSILGHLANRTNKLNQVMSKYLLQLNECKKIDEVKAIKPIF